MKTMKSPGILMGILMGVLAGVAVSAEARDRDTNPPPEQICQWVQRDGYIPIPFEEVNQRVELVDGDFYALKGKMLYVGSQPFLEIDLNYQPWLGRLSTTVNPIYPITNTLVDWHPYEGHPIRMVVKAKGMIETDSAGKQVYRVWLEPIMY